MCRKPGMSLSLSVVRTEYMIHYIAGVAYILTDEGGVSDPSVIMVS